MHHPPRAHNSPSQSCHLQLPELALCAARFDAHKSPSAWAQWAFWSPLTPNSLVFNSPHHDCEGLISESQHLFPLVSCARPVPRCFLHCRTSSSGSVPSHGASDIHLQTRQPAIEAAGSRRRLPPPLLRAANTFLPSCTRPNRRLCSSCSPYALARRMPQPPSAAPTLSSLDR